MVGRWSSKSRTPSLRKTRWLRDFCVTQWCFVVLSGEFATDIPRAWLLKINYLQ